MDWSVLPGIIGTGVVALSSVTVTALFGARTEKRRLAADAVRLEIEAGRETERMRREDEAEARQAESEQSAAAAALAQEIADQFLDGLRDIRDFEEVDDAGFESYFESKWQKRLDIALRKNVGRVLDDADRNRLIEVLDALEDASGLAYWNLAKVRQMVESLLLLGFDLAATASRGQKLDTELEARVLTLRERVTGLNEHRDMQQELQREQRLIEARAQVPKPPKRSE